MYILLGQLHFHKGGKAPLTIEEEVAKYLERNFTQHFEVGLLETSISSKTERRAENSIISLSFQDLLSGICQYKQIESQISATEPLGGSEILNRLGNGTVMKFCQSKYPARNLPLTFCQSKYPTRNLPLLRLTFL